jgi:predicted outer membrane protein
LPLCLCMGKKGLLIIRAVGAVIACAVTAARTPIFAQQATTRAVSEGLPAVADTPLSDPQVAALLAEADRAAIDAAQLELEKGANREVRALASDALHDHMALLRQEQKVAQQLSAAAQPPRDDPFSERYAQDHALLANTDAGAGFDELYTTSQIADDEGMLALLHRLSVEAHDHDLGMLLDKRAEPMVRRHLARARAIRGARSGI